MIGYPTVTVGQDVTNTLAGTTWDLIQKCDQSRPYNLKSMTGSDNMAPGRGYWVHVTTDCTATISSVEPTPVEQIAIEDGIDTITTQENDDQNSVPVIVTIINVISMLGVGIVVVPGVLSRKTRR